MLAPWHEALVNVLLLLVATRCVTKATDLVHVGSPADRKMSDLSECVTSCSHQVSVVAREIAEYDRHHVKGMSTQERPGLLPVARCQKACRSVVAAATDPESSPCKSISCAQEPECLAACWFFKDISDKTPAAGSFVCSRRRLTLTKQHNARLDITIFWLPLQSLSVDTKGLFIQPQQMKLTRLRYKITTNTAHHTHRESYNTSSNRTSLSFITADTDLGCFGYNYFIQITGMIQSPSLPDSVAEYSLHTFDLCSPYLYNTTANELKCASPKEPSEFFCRQPCPPYRQRCKDAELVALLEKQPTFMNKSLRSLDIYPIVAIQDATLSPSCNMTQNHDSVHSSLDIEWKWQVDRPLIHEQTDYKPENDHTCWCQQSCELNFTFTIATSNGSVVNVTSILTPSNRAYANASILLPDLSCLSDDSYDNNSMPKIFSVEISGHYKDDIIFGGFMSNKRLKTFTFSIDPCNCVEPPKTSPTTPMVKRSQPASPKKGIPPPPPVSSPERDQAIMWKVAIPVVIALGIILAFVAVFAIRNIRMVPASKSRWRRLFSMNSEFTQPPSPMKSSTINTKVERTNYSYVSVDSIHQAAKRGDWYSFPSQLEFPVQNLTLERQLGTGQFGCVWLAKATGINDDERWSHVAVKMLRDGSPEKDAQDFLKEAEHLSSFRHPNIISLLGLVVHGNPKMVVLEYMDGGDLQAFLKQKKANSCLVLWDEVDFVDIALDVAKGLKYLQKRKFVHRDVAARNCLVSFCCDTSKPSGIHRITKLADFGMARHLRGSEEYTLIHNDALLPIRWLAPECISKGVFTHASDVWSYGILLWEIYTFGDTPYAHITTSHTIAAHICSGATMDQPDICPRRMYALMRHCWAKQARSRPSFNYIVTFLESFQQGFLRRRTQSTTLALSTLEASVGEYLGSTSLDLLDRCIPTPNTRVRNPAIIVESADEADSVAKQCNDDMLASQSCSNLSIISQSDHSGSVFQPPTPDVFLTDERSDWSSSDL